ncbi:hypothetical protein ACIPL1_19655 [Pseudomonas sp. NPDC090202]|uniref:hypothetical protein n=1 Tax=unclassified Pseudomonas TaxID=196821 RepID=UPI0038309128
MSRLNAAEKVEAAIIVINDTIAQRAQETFEFTNPSQLTQFRARLIQALERILKNEIPERKYRELGIAKIITGQWPYDLDLGLKIIAAEQAYKAI